MHFCLKHAPKHVHRCGGGEVLGEFLGELGQVFFHVLFVCPLPKVDFSPYWLLACRKNNGVHKHDIVIAYARQRNTPVYKRWPICAEDIQGVVYPCGKVYYLVVHTHTHTHTRTHASTHARTPEIRIIPVFIIVFFFFVTAYSNAYLFSQNKYRYKHVNKF